MKSNRSSAVTRRALTAALLTAPVLLGLAACKPEAPVSSAPATPAAAANSATASAPAAAETPVPVTALPTPGDASPSAAPKPEDLAAAAKAAGLPPEALAQLLNQQGAPTAPLPDVVATVEGQEIKKEELEQAFATELARQGIPPDQLPANQRAQGYKMILNDLITEKLVSKRAASMEAKEEDINAQFEQLKSRFPKQEDFEAQLTKSGQTPEKIREDIRSYLKQQAWVKEQIKDAPKATDADAEEFYTKNPDQFKKPEQVRASHILLSVAADAPEATVQEKQKAAAAIAARVKGGEAFDKLAAELSEDPSAKQNSGDLNFFTKEQMVPEFSTAAFGMKKGDISEPVKSQFGFHIIQVTDRKDAETMTLEAVKPQLLAFLNQKMQSTQVEQLIKDVREKAAVEIKLP
jgi:peptidyl-prolyl cis-trans isomerase C